MTTATEPSTGIVHKLDGDATRCGKNALGWSRAITEIQLLGLVLECQECSPVIGDTRACPGCGRPQHYTGTEMGWCHDVTFAMLACGASPALLAELEK